MRYLFPCKPNTLKPSSSFFREIDNDVRWIAEVKKNGWRCLLEASGGRLTLWTREKALIAQPLKPLRDALAGLNIPAGTLLDGEILDFRAPNSRGRIYLFDIIYLEDRLLSDLSLLRRRKILESIIRETPGVELARQVMVGKRHLFDSLTDEEDEGIVLKRLDSRYPVSDNACLKNPFWLKVRRDAK